MEVLTQKQIAEIVKSVASSHGYEVLAVRFNCSVMTIYNWTNGKTEPKASQWEVIKKMHMERRKE